VIDFIVILFFITLTAWVAGYREVESLIRDKSWLKQWFRIKFWKAKWNLDSYHFMGGLRVLLNTIAVVSQGFWLMWSGTLIVRFIFLVDLLTSNIWIGGGIALLHIPLYWWIWYYQRNIFMHIISRDKDYREWKYLNPIKIKKRKQQ